MVIATGGSRTPALPPVGPMETSSVPRKKVLVVDDDPVFADTLARLILEVGHDVMLAETAEEALERCRAELPDFVLVDIRLPQLDGYAFAKRLQEEEHFRGKIVALSGFPPDGLRQAQAGIFYHLPKELGLESVRAFLRSL